MKQKDYDDALETLAAWRKEVERKQDLIHELQEHISPHRDRLLKARAAKVGLTIKRCQRSSDNQWRNNAWDLYDSNGKCFLNHCTAWSISAKIDRMEAAAKEGVI